MIMIDNVDAMIIVEMTIISPNNSDHDIVIAAIMIIIVRE